MANYNTFLRKINRALSAYLINMCRQKGHHTFNKREASVIDRFLEWLYNQFYTETRKTLNKKGCGEDDKSNTAADDHEHAADSMVPGKRFGGTG